MSDRPPIVIQFEGWNYRRTSKVGREGGGRPPKTSRVSDTGEDEWFCPCCEEWKTADYFGVDNNAVNGLKSWCRRCCLEATRMRRGISGGALPDWEKE